MRSWVHLKDNWVHWRAVLKSSSSWELCKFQNWSSSLSSLQLASSQLELDSRTALCLLIFMKMQIHKIYWCNRLIIVPCVLYSCQVYCITFSVEKIGPQIWDVIKNCPKYKNAQKASIGPIWSPCSWPTCCVLQQRVLLLVSDPLDVERVRAEVVLLQAKAGGVAGRDFILFVLCVHFCIRKALVL
jgi:hypothetical protein